MYQEYRFCLCSLWMVMYICVSGISMLSLFLVSGQVYVCQEYRCCLCSLWVVMYMCVRNIYVVSVPCEWSCICLSGISMLSLFLVSGHAYVCQEYRCCLCSLWVVKYMCVRNIDVVSVPCEWSCICVSGISMLSLFLVSGHVYVCQEYRCYLCSLWVVMYKSVRNIDVVSVPCEWSCICFRNIDVVSVPCEWSCICLSGISMLSLFYVSGHAYVCQEYRCCLCSLLCGHVYVCQEYRCSLCSLWVVMYISVRNIEVVSVSCEWSFISLSGISM